MRCHNVQTRLTRKKLVYLSGTIVNYSLYAESEGLDGECGDVEENKRCAFRPALLPWRWVIHNALTWVCSAILGLAAVLFGCGGKQGSLPAPPSTLPASTPPSVAITAQPISINPGSSTVLSWTSSNSTSVSISGIGNVAVNGSATVVPASTTTFTATASGRGGTATSHVTVTVASSSGVPVFRHVFELVEENHGYSSVIGNESMPYLNALVTKYGLAARYYANTHPSIGNYFMLTTGQIITNDDSFNGLVSDDNIVRHIIAAGETWKSYAESLPSFGYTGDDVYPYVRHHNPFTYFSDILNSSTEANNLVPFTQFSTDLQNSQLPQFSFIVPNLLNDAHDGTLTQADEWLQTNIDPLITSPTFQLDGLLIIVFDEADTSDTTYGGGHVVMAVISSLARKGYLSPTFFQHESTLRLIMEGLGQSNFPGAAARAPDMSEFF